MSTYHDKADWFKRWLDHIEKADADLLLIIDIWSSTGTFLPRKVNVNTLIKRINRLEPLRKLEMLDTMDAVNDFRRSAEEGAEKENVSALPREMLLRFLAPFPGDKYFHNFEGQERSNPSLFLRRAIGVVAISLWRKADLLARAVLSFGYRGDYHFFGVIEHVLSIKSAENDKSEGSHRENWNSLAPHKKLLVFGALDEKILENLYILGEEKKLLDSAQSYLDIFHESLPHLATCHRKASLLFDIFEEGKRIEKSYVLTVLGLESIGGNSARRRGEHDLQRIARRLSKKREEREEREGEIAAKVLEELCMPLIDGGEGEKGAASSAEVCSGIDVKSSSDTTSTTRVSATSPSSPSPVSIIFSIYFMYKEWKKFNEKFELRIQKHAKQDISTSTPSDLLFLRSVSDLDDNDLLFLLTLEFSSENEKFEGKFDEVSEISGISGNQREFTENVRKLMGMLVEESDKQRRQAQVKERM